MDPLPLVTMFMAIVLMLGIVVLIALQRHIDKQPKPKRKREPWPPPGTALADPSFSPYTNGTCGEMPWELDSSGKPIKEPSPI